MKPLAFLLKLCVTGTVLYLILSHVSLKDVLLRSREISLATIIIAILLLSAHVVISAIRWRVVLECLGVNASWVTVFSGTLLERFLNQALPSTVSGDAGRVLSVKRQGWPLPVSLLSVVIDRGLALGGIVLAVAIGLPLAIHFFPDYRLRDALVGVVAVCGLGTIVLLGLPAAVLAYLSNVKGFRRLSKLVTKTRSLLMSWKFTAIGFGTSLLAQLLLVFVFQLIAHDLGATLSFTEAFAAVPAMTLVALIPLTLAGWGARESLAVIMLGFFGISAENALATSILYGLLTLFVSCAGAIIWLVLELAFQPRTAPESAAADSRQ
jgi:glycosyltransferase 2 family protein